MTLANASIIGSLPHALFIDTHNRIYAVNHENGQIHVWLDDEFDSYIILYGNLKHSKSVFVTTTGDIYVNNAETNHQVEKFTLNSNKSVPVMLVPGNCYGLFVDIADSIYCSVDNAHKVFKKWLGDNSTTITTVAGNGSAGSAPNMLHYPNGIFVDTNFDLFVADLSNDRIQLFRLGQQDGITVAGKSSTAPTIELSGPLNVILDGNRYLYIADHNNHRIVTSGPFGFRCIIGCVLRDSSTDQLNGPRGIAFDSFGNLFIGDQQSHRIQKFALRGNLCSK